MAMSELDMRALAESYGLTYDFIQTVPELKGKFQQAVKEGWNETKWTAVLKNTNWWRTTSDSARKYIDLRTTDPTTWKAKWDQIAFHMNELAVQAGVGNLLGKGTDWGKMDYLLQNATWASFSEGWTDEKIKAWFGGSINQSNNLSGEAGQLYNQLVGLAYANGRSYQSDWYTDQIRRVMGGQGTAEQIEQQIRKEAAADYKAFSQQILAGQNVMDVAAPYMKTVSDLLEIPSGNLSLSDPLMRKALTGTSKDGGAYSLWQLENDVRNDERWKKTKNAQDTLMQLGHNVLSTFGFAF